MLDCIHHRPEQWIQSSFVVSQPCLASFCGQAPKSKGLTLCTSNVNEVASCTVPLTPGWSEGMVIGKSSTLWQRIKHWPLVSSPHVESNYVTELSEEISNSDALIKPLSTGNSVYIWNCNHPISTPLASLFRCSLCSTWHRVLVTGCLATFVVI